MDALDALRAAIPDVAKDIRLNVSAVMKGGALTEAQRWGVAVASAIAARNPRLREAISRTPAARRRREWSTMPWRPLPSWR